MTGRRSAVAIMRRCGYTHTLAPDPAVGTNPERESKMRRYGFPVFFRLVKKTLFQSKGTFARLTPKRALTMSVFIPGLFFGQLMHRIAFFLDDIFFPGYKDIEIERPMFMVGIPRSGTTFIHRLVSKDTENFTTLTTWEMVLAPSIIERKVLMALGKVDSALGGYGKKLVMAVEDRMFAVVRKIHKIGLYEAEEDDIALFPIFASMFMLFPFPFPEEMNVHARFDVDMPKEDRDAIMAFYRDCVKRHLYVHGTDKRFLSKNPVFTGRVDALAETFPGCHILCNVRSPYDAVPSLLSFLSFSWRRFDNDMRGQEFYEMMMEIVAHWYRHPVDRFPHLPEGQSRFVTYTELTEDLENALNQLYEQFDLTFGPIYTETLKVEFAKARAYKSKHSYNLSEFGLTPERLQRDFGDVFERFGFSTEYGA